MIHRLRVQGYKSLIDVDLTFAPLTVVFGPNAAGKSNLLDLLSLVAAMVTEPSLDAAFTTHRGTPLEAFSFGEGGLEELSEQRESASFTVSIDLELSDAVVDAVEAEVSRAREGLPDENGSHRRSIQERHLRYTLEIEVRTSSGHLRVMNEQLEALRSDWQPKAHTNRRPFIERDATTGRLHLRMERQAHPIYEDVGQDRTVASKAPYPPHYPHLTALREELRRWRIYFLEPSAMRDESALKEVEVLGPNGANVAAFYNTVRVGNQRQFDDFASALQLVVPSLTGLEVLRTPQGFLRLQVREGPMPVSSRLMSEGTLRVLGLLAITNPRTPLSVVGFEEPENGIHSRRLTTVARILTEAADRGNTQFIVNTHSPLLPTLFEHVPEPGVALVTCRKEGRQTVFEPFRPLGGMFSDQEVDAVLDDAPAAVGERIARGDFGG